MERDSMVFYRSFYESVKDLDADDFKSAVVAIMEYGLNGTRDAGEGGIAKTVLTLVAPQIDKNNQRYESAKKGGRKGNQTVTEEKSNQNQTKPKPKLNRTATENKPNKNQTETEAVPNVNVNDNDKDNDKENDIPPLNPPTGEKVTATAMIDERGFPEPLESAVKEWVQYKAEKRQGYKPTGLKSLLTEVAKNAAKYGNPVVIDVIRKSIAANYTGIVWDWCRARQPTPVKKWASDEPPDYDPYAGVDKDALADFIRATEGDEVDQDVLDAFYHAKKGG